VILHILSTVVYIGHSETVFLIRQSGYETLCNWLCRPLIALWSRFAGTILGTISTCSVYI